MREKALPDQVGCYATDRSVRPPAPPAPPPTLATQHLSNPVAYHPAYGTLTAWAGVAFAVLLGFSRLSYGLLLPALRADLAGSYGAFGLVGSANLAGYLVGTLLSPALTARGGRRQLNAAAILLTGATMLGSATSATLLQLGLWRFAIGISSAVATVLTIALTLERVAPAERGRASGVIWSGGALGIALSGLAAPFVLGAGASSVWRPVWVVMGIVGFVAAWGFSRALRDGPLAPGPRAVLAGVDRGGLRAVLADLLHPRRLLPFTIAYTLFGGGYIIYFTYFVALATQEGLPATQAGLVWALLGLMGVVGGIGWGRAVDRWPSGFVFALALGLAALGGLAVLAPLRGIAFLGVLPMGTAAIGAPALMTALLRRAVPGERYTASFSLITAAFASAQMLGPVIGGLVADARGLALATALGGIILAGTAGFAVLYGLHMRSRS